MIKEDVKIVISSENGQNEYIVAYISRTTARKIERVLTEDGCVISGSYKMRQPKRNEVV